MFGAFRTMNAHLPVDRQEKPATLRKQGTLALAKVVASTENHGTECITLFTEHKSLGNRERRRVGPCRCSRGQSRYSIGNFGTYKMAEVSFATGLALNIIVLIASE